MYIHLQSTTIATWLLHTTYVASFCVPSNLHAFSVPRKPWLNVHPGQGTQSCPPGTWPGLYRPSEVQAKRDILSIMGRLDREGDSVNRSVLCGPGASSYRCLHGSCLCTGRVTQKTQFSVSRATFKWKYRTCSHDQAHT